MKKITQARFNTILLLESTKRIQHQGKLDILPPSRTGFSWVSKAKSSLVYTRSGLEPLSRSLAQYSMPQVSVLTLLSSPVFGVSSFNPQDPAVSSQASMMVITYLHPYLHISQPLNPHHRLPYLISRSLPTDSGRSFLVPITTHLLLPYPSESNPSLLVCLTLELHSVSKDLQISSYQLQLMAEAFITMLDGTPWNDGH